MAYEMIDFQKDVLEASRKLPVLVDFWAPWCGPCRALSPVLERLAGEQQARWTLVKINSDEHPDLAGRFGVRGIPSVKLIVDGEVVDEFTGALPEHTIRQWLDKAIPTRTGRLVEQARKQFAEGRTTEAAASLEAALEEDPSHPEARILLARMLVFDDPRRTASLLDGVDAPTAETVQIVGAVRQLANALTADASTLPSGDGRELYASGLDALRRGDFEEAISRLIDVLQRDRYYADDAARKTGISLFALLGPQHPVAAAKRRLFDMYLY